MADLCRSAVNLQKIAKVDLVQAFGPTGLLTRQHNVCGVAKLLLATGGLLTFYIDNTANIVWTGKYRLINNMLQNLRLVKHVIYLLHLLYLIRIIRSIFEADFRLSRNDGILKASVCLNWNKAHKHTHTDTYTRTADSSAGLPPNNWNYLVYYNNPDLISGITLFWWTGR